MLECKLCDYYNAIHSGHGEAAKCNFTGVLFSENVEMLEMEYPCRNVSYAEYLQRNTQSTKKVNEYSFDNDDWQYFYKRNRAADARERYLLRAI